MVVLSQQYQKSRCGGQVLSEVPWKYLGIDSTLEGCGSVLMSTPEKLRVSGWLPQGDCYALSLLENTVSIGIFGGGLVMEARLDRGRS